MYPMLTSRPQVPDDPVHIDLSPTVSSNLIPSSSTNAAPSSSMNSDTKPGERSSVGDSREISHVNDKTNSTSLASATSQRSNHHDDASDIAHNSPQPWNPGLLASLGLNTNSTGTTSALSTSPPVNLKPVVLIVHGAWHTPYHYFALIRDLTLAGFPTLCPQHLTCTNTMPPPYGLADDCTAIRNLALLLAEKGHPIIAVMHSYGGVVGTQALAGLDWASRRRSGLPGGVTALVYMCAFSIPVGSSLFTPFGEQLPPFMRGHEDGTCNMDDSYHKFFSADVASPDTPLARDLLDHLTRHPTAAQATPITRAAYLDPDMAVTYIVTEKDVPLPAAAQRGMIAQMRAEGVTVHEESCVAGHSPMISVPEKVTAILGRVWARWLAGQSGNSEGPATGAVTGVGMAESVPHHEAPPPSEGADAMPAAHDEPSIAPSPDGTTMHGRHSEDNNNESGLQKNVTPPSPATRLSLIDSQTGVYDFGASPKLSHTSSTTTPARPTTRTRSSSIASSSANSVGSLKSGIASVIASILPGRSRSSSFTGGKQEVVDPTVAVTDDIYVDGVGYLELNGQAEPPMQKGRSRSGSTLEEIGRTLGMGMVGL